MPNPIKNLFHLIAKTCLFATFFLSILIPAQAAWFDRLPATASNPDGSLIHCFATGDEFYNWLHDAEGFTIIAGDDGFHYYGVQDGDFVVPSQFRVGSVNPAAQGLTPWAQLSRAEYQKRRDAFWEGADRSVRAPHTGTLNSLTVYIRFSDQTEFTAPRSFYDNRFNNPDGISMKNYFYEVSYEQINIETTHYPICDLSTNLSYQDQYPRSYYLPYHAVNNPNGYQGDTQRRLREHTLLLNAIAYIHDEVPTDLEIDADGDGYVDNVCFIIRGNSGNWADLLWAHRWVLYSFNVYIHGKRVYDYTFQPENQNDTYTLCHEMFHVLGAPDLYHYNSTGFTPVGAWDLMHSGFVHMGAFMKYKYANQNWISEIPEITQGGSYTLNPITSPENNAFKIASPNHSSQYFVVEYRKREGLYETNLPGDGLLVYRINPAAGNGNAQGPPDEVYLYRPNGTTTSNGQVNQANYSLNVNRTAINDETNPSSFLQNGSPGGLNIFNISAVGETISFDILIGNEVQANFSADATTILEGSSVQFTDQSTNLPTEWDWTFPGGLPETSTAQHPLVTYPEKGIFPVGLIAGNSQGGTGHMFRDNFIIVGTPMINLDETPIQLNLETNSSETHLLSIQNNGDTWLRYHLDYEYADGGASSGEAGQLLGQYGNLPNNVTSMVWAEGQLFLSTYNGQLHNYDTLSQQITQTYAIHNQPMGMAYDGQLLWIGNTSGLLRAYELDGTETGETIELFTSEVYAITWDGTYFLGNRIMQSSPLLFRFNHMGEIIETFYMQTGSANVTQLCWVDAHKSGQLWANSGGKVIRFGLMGNSYTPIDDFVVNAPMSYGLSHDGTDLWWMHPSGILNRYEDGLLEWLTISWTENLLEAGNTKEIPLFFNAKSMQQGSYEATVSITSNDYIHNLIEIPVYLNVTLPTSLPTISTTEKLEIYSNDGRIIVKNPNSTTVVIEVFELTGKLVKSIKSAGNPIIIDGLRSQSLYIVRLTTNSEVTARKVLLF